MNRDFNKCPWCGAEMKVSKKGNVYCSNICWEKEPYKTDRELDSNSEIIETHHGDWGNRI